jgi:predicted metal-dependent phosphoesterase TrpH
LGRQHVAHYLASTRQVASVREAFARYLGNGRPAYVSTPGLECGRAINLIQRAGGVAALAHPPRRLEGSRLEAIVDQGVRAMEVDSPGFSTGRSNRLRALADSFGLVGIAGSDFHTPDRPGRWVGAVTTTLNNLERLRAARLVATLPAHGQVQLRATQRNR